MRLASTELIKVPPGRVRPRRQQPFSAQAGTVDAFPASEGPSEQALASSTPVVVPPDPTGVLSHSHSAHELLANDALVIVRYAHVRVQLMIGNLKC